MMIAADGGAEACEENEGGTMGIGASDTYDTILGRGIIILKLHVYTVNHISEVSIYRSSMLFLFLL